MNFLDKNVQINTVDLKKYMVLKEDLNLEDDNLKLDFIDIDKKNNSNKFTNNKDHCEFNNEIKNYSNIKNDQMINNHNIKDQGNGNKTPKREKPKKNNFIEIKLNLFDFKEKALNKKTEIINDISDTKDESNNKSYNTTNINALNTNTNTRSLIKQENTSKYNNNNNNFSNSNSLYEKLMKNNNLKNYNIQNNNNNPKKNEKEEVINKNKTSDNLILESFLNSERRDESPFFNKYKENDPKEKSNNFQISSILSIGNKINKNKKNNDIIKSINSINKSSNYLELNKSKKLKDNMKSKNSSKTDRKEGNEDNIPLWIENDNNDLDFSVNTLCYDKANDKLNSMPNKFVLNKFEDEFSDKLHTEKKFFETNINAQKIMVNESNISNNTNRWHHIRSNSLALMNSESQSLQQSHDDYQKTHDNHFKTNIYNDSSVSYISHHSHNSNLQINLNSNPTLEENYDSADETVFIRREDSNTKKIEKDDLIIVII